MLNWMQLCSNKILFFPEEPVHYRNIVQAYFLHWLTLDRLLDLKYIVKITTKLRCQSYKEFIWKLVASGGFFKQALLALPVRAHTDWDLDLFWVHVEFFPEGSPVQKRYFRNYLSIFLKLNNISRTVLSFGKSSVSLKCP